MADIRKLYKQLSKYGKNGKVVLDEKSGILQVKGDIMSADAKYHDDVLDINIDHLGYKYESMTNKPQDDFGILYGILDGCLIPEMSEQNDKLIVLKEKNKSKPKRLMSAYSLTFMAVGIILILLSAFRSFSILLSSQPDDAKKSAIYWVLTAFMCIVGLILTGKGFSSTKLKFGSYVFSMVNQRPKDADIDKLFNKVVELTTTDAIEINLDNNRVPALFDSKIGGVPYWDMSKPYPTNNRGEKLMLLAQINLSQLPDNDKLPKKGMLQFFVMPDSSYGLYFDGSNDGHKVVYHDHIDESLTEKKVWELGISTSLEADRFPVIGEFAVNFEKVRVPMSPGDIRFGDKIEAASNRLNIFTGTYDPYELFSEEQTASLKAQSMTHGMLGNPDFVHWDVRGNEDAKKYDILLFQLGSQENVEKSDIYPGRKLMWGDSGIARFFINDYALSKLDFSDVLYNWDC